MQVFVAGLCHETSAFSPIPTNRRSFETFDYHRPLGGVPDAIALERNGYGAFIRAAQARDHGVYASTYTWAQPSLPCTRDGYESLRDEILADLKRMPPPDMVLLFLHGAQMADGYEDCEGDLIERVRAVVGPVPFVGALLDLHANVTRRMVAAADALVACRNYPHTDFDERAEELYRLGERAVAGEVKPTMVWRPLPMIGMFYTTSPLMAAVNDAATKLQAQAGVLSTSVIHGFLWADILEMGAGVLAVTDGPQPGIETELDQISALFFAARDETRSLRRPIAAILDAVERAGPGSGPFVIADACDNAGGGAGSDSTFILEHILARGLTGYAIALLWDPVVAALADAAGEGASFAVRLGGKTGPLAGSPLDVQVRVLAVHREGSQSGIGFQAPTGLNVALEVAGNIVIVNDVRGQVFSPSCFADVGVDPAKQRALVVKSTQHFHAQFAPIARAIFYCETPGSLSLDIDPKRYRNLRRPIWPVDDINSAMLGR